MQDHEFIYPYYRLKEEGFDIVLALKDGKETTGILGTKIPCDSDAKIIPYEDLDKYWDSAVLVIPGGAKAMEYLRQEKGVLNFIKKWDDAKKWIFVICHGAQLLISAKCIKGKKISGYYSIQDDIENAGGIYERDWVVDENVVSASHYKHLGDWMKYISHIG